MVNAVAHRGGLSRLRGRAADAALAATVFTLVGLGSLRSLIGGPEESWQATLIGWAMIAAGCGALYFARRAPVLVSAFCLVTTIGYYLQSVYDGPLMIAFVVSLYVVSAKGRLRAAVGLASLIVMLTGAGTLAGNDDVNGVALFMLTGWLVGVVALGWVWRHRRVMAREAEQRAAYEERMRIARELHDVIGHHISLINVQSAAALRRIQKDPARGAAGAEEALGAIKGASREALRELRTTLGVLRRVDEAAPTAPVPGLHRLDDIVASARLAGLEVRMETGEAHSGLPAEVDLAAYRVIQESLTNVTRHARATTVTIRTVVEPGQLTVEVTDDGRGHEVWAPGSGINGMRERARALGGELAAGPRADGGFTVRARFPCRTVKTDGVRSTS